jgi:hypothetical protein
MPDLFVNASEIFFSNNNPIENETINITAMIRNIGYANASDFNVEFRLNATSGALLANYSINLSVNASINLTINYTLPIGDTRFHIVVDPPLSINGTIREENESNNNASALIHVGLWQFVIGTGIDRLVMRNNANATVFDWIVSNSTGSKIYATDVDSNIGWLYLQALGRNTSNISSPSDFYSLDTKLGSTGFTDSVNRTYTSAGSPLETANYDLFNKMVNNVPIYNSTNNSNFKTGILWDYGDGGNTYNGTQDIIFLSQINKNTQGYNGTVDYEIRVPALLRSYKSGVDMVAFYVELE